MDQNIESDVDEDKRIVETVDDGRSEHNYAIKRKRLEVPNVEPKKSVSKRKSKVMINPAKFVAVERDMSSTSGMDLDEAYLSFSSTLTSAATLYLRR